LLAARHALQQGDVDGARHRLDELRDSASTRRQRLDLALAWLAVTLTVDADPQPRADVVFDVASAEGFVFPITEAGAEVLAAVQRVARQRPHSQYVDALLQARPPTTASSPLSGTHVDALSERERTVLRYLATSLSYSEIAEALFVSQNTVKTHVRHITTKLQVSSRGDAVQRARELRYL
jgi:LuxR family maltose regulon positive regulatory protein